MRGVSWRETPLNVPAWGWGERGISHQPQVFSYEQLNRQWCHFWDAGDWRWKRLKRGMKSSVLNRLSLRLLVDKQAAGHRSREHITPSLGSFTLGSNVTWSVRFFLNTLYRKVSPSLSILHPSYFALFFSITLITIWHIVSHLPVSPAKDYPLLVTRDVVYFAHCCIPGYLNVPGAPSFVLNDAASLGELSKATMKEMSADNLSQVP